MEGGSGGNRSRRCSSTSSSSRKASSSAAVSEKQLKELLSKLQSLLPEICESGDKMSASKVLQETCNYIKSLHREVDDLSERLAEMLATSDNGNDQAAALIRSLLTGS